MDLRFTFNEDVVNYDKMRPTYVGALFKDVIRFSGLDSGKNVLEIGIGTGQATALFLQTGCKLTAIELGENMAAFAQHKFAGFDNFSVINSDFESIKLENESYDLIYSATAFHWIPQELGYTKVFDLLKGGGTLALFWNHPSMEQNELYTKMQETYSKYQPGDRGTVHKFSEDKCIEIADTIKSYGFADVECKLYHSERVFDAQQYISLLNTYSDHRSRQEDSRLLFETELANVINKYGGSVKIQDTIDLYLAKKP